MVDISRKRTTLIIERAVKFWYLQRPLVAGLPPDRSTASGAEVASALVVLQVADVPLERCPATWGEALTLAMGDAVWARVKTRPTPASR